MDPQAKECSGCGDPIPIPPKQCSCKKPQVVVCAANRSTVTGKIIAGARHWDYIMRQQVDWHTKSPTEKTVPPEWACAEQGFIDQYGQFLTREEAWVIAKSNNQIKHPPTTTQSKRRNPIQTSCILYSEDLY